MNDLDWNDYFDNDRECGYDEVDEQINLDNGDFCEMDDDIV